MSWLRKKPRSVAPHGESGGTSLHALKEAGAERVLFVLRCKQGEPCAAARLIENGRIPVGLAEPIPLAGCSNLQGCECSYQVWPADEVTTNSSLMI